MMKFKRAISDLLKYLYTRRAPWGSDQSHTDLYRPFPPFFLYIISKYDVSPAATARHLKLGIPARGFLQCMRFWGVERGVLIPVSRSLLCSGPLPFPTQKTHFWKNRLNNALLIRQSAESLKGALEFWRCFWPVSCIFERREVAPKIAFKKFERGENRLKKVNENMRLTKWIKMTYAVSQNAGPQRRIPGLG